MQQKTFTQRLRLVASIGAIALLLTACGGGGGGGGTTGGGTTPTPTPTVAATIGTITPAVTQDFPLNQAFTIPYTFSSGSYTSHSVPAGQASFMKCGGNDVANVTAPPATVGSTAGNIIVSPPVTGWPASQTCVLTVDVNGVTSAPGAASVKVVTASVTVRMAAIAIPPQVLLGIGAPSATGSAPMMKIDLTTRAVTSAGVNINVSIACSASNSLTNVALARIVCGLGSSHWDYNPLTGTSVQNTALANIPSSRWATVISSPDGEDAYGVGASGTGQVLIRQGNAFVASIDLSTKATNNPQRLLADYTQGTKGKWYTLNENEFLQGGLTVDRMDIATRRVDASYADEKQGAGIALYNGELYVAMRRNSRGMDVVKLNTSFTKSAEGATSGTVANGGGNHVYSIAVDANGVHLGTGTGIQTLSLDLTRVLRTVPFPGGFQVSHITTAGAGKLIVIVEGKPTNNVMEVDSATGTVLNSWTIAGNPQRPVVYGR